MHRLYCPTSSICELCGLTLSIALVMLHRVMPYKQPYRPSRHLSLMIRHQAPVAIHRLVADLDSEVSTLPTYRGCACFNCVVFEEAFTFRSLATHDSDRGVTL